MYVKCFASLRLRFKATQSSLRWCRHEANHFLFFCSISYYIFTRSSEMIMNIRQNVKIFHWINYNTVFLLFASSSYYFVSFFSKSLFTQTHKLYLYFACANAIKYFIYSFYHLAHIYVLFRAIFFHFHYTVHTCYYMRFHCLIFSQYTHKKICQIKRRLLLLLFYFCYRDQRLKKWYLNDEKTVCVLANSVSYKQNISHIKFQEIKSSILNDACFINSIKIRWNGCSYAIFHRKKNKTKQKQRRKKHDRRTL